MTIFASPNLEYGALAPMLIIFITALLGVIVEGFVSAKNRPLIQLSVSLGGIILAFAQILRLRGATTTSAEIGRAHV